MELTWDEAKRQKTFNERGLDFADCLVVFDGPTYTFPDERKPYGEERFVVVGHLKNRMVVIVYTPRGENVRHIISMRKANEREQAIYTQAPD
jgi:uncharacterized protein